MLRLVRRNIYNAASNEDGMLLPRRYNFLKSDS